MNSFYIYAYQYEETLDDQTSKVSATVIFCSCNDIDEADLQSEISEFYNKYYQTDKIFILGSNHNTARLTEVFITNQDETFKGIPKRQDTFLSENIFLLSFDKNAALNCINDKTIPLEFIESFVNEGLQQIFILRGGLIVSESSHHYVFPSGKHCDRFLRTGNILLYSPEIFFIAFALLKHFDDTKYNRIYCDTSSINSIAFALFDLKNSFLEARKNVSIESFSSYDGLYKKQLPYTKDSFLLISASTSSNIIKYILDLHNIIERDNIIILYFLGENKDYSNVKDQVLCNLTQSDINETGIPYYPTFLERDCEFCKKGSYSVPVSGDVFLLEKPRINKIQLALDDRDKGLSPFVKQFKSRQKKETVLKVHFKEDSTNKYEVYIDYSQLLINLKSNPEYDKYKNKLNNYIDQYIPSNSKYLLHLNDDGSKDLASYIFEKIKPNYTKEALPQIFDQENLENMDPAARGSVVVIGSCISNGKNLLYISRALRKFRHLRITYFIGIVRTLNNDYLTNLKSNLKMGQYGGETNSFIAVETMFCSNMSRFTPWLIEIDFMNEIILFLQDEKPEMIESLTFFEGRKQYLLEKSADTQRGMTEKLFFKRITPAKPEELELRRTFAFWSFPYSSEDITQSDVYFTICNVINSLRNSENISKHLKQAVFVRNLLDPSNFNRFNDGIIQASILRAAKAEELAYSIDAEISQEMYNNLETMVTYHEQEQGEALVEFLYAIAIKKLSLTKPNLTALLNTINSNCKKEVFLCLASFIQLKLIDEPEKLRSAPLTAKEADGIAMPEIE